MSVTADAGGEPRPRQQLGQLLIEAGLLTPAALELALTEQKQTGKTLGQILVSRGFLPAPTVAAALAEQAGGLLKTEYGYATGLSPSMRRAAHAGPVVPPPPPPVTDSELADVVPIAPVTDEAPALLAVPDATEAPLAAVVPAPAETPAQPPPAPSAEMDNLRARHEALVAAHAQLEGILGERDTRISELETQLAALTATHGEAMVALASARTAVEGERQRFEEMLPELARSAAESVELRRQLAEQSEIRARSEGALAERSRIEEEIARLALAHAERDDRRLEAKVEEQAAALMRAQAETAAAEERAARAEAELIELRAELAQAQAEPEPEAEPEPVPDARHLLFAPAPEGYELLEGDGPAPALDEIVVLGPERELRVVRIARSPLPGDCARCAYLERIPAAVTTA